MKFITLKDSEVNQVVKAGTTVYSFHGSDWGLARDAERQTGIEHITVTLNADGSAPGFTIPRQDLEIA